MNKNYFSLVLTILAAILWGIISLFSKPLMLMGFSAMQIVLIRAFFSSVLLGCFIFVKNKSLFKIRIKDLFLFSGTGILGFIFCVFCYMFSIEENGVGVAAMLMYTSPIWSMIFSRLIFKENINFYKIIAIFGILIACFTFSIGGKFKFNLLGLILGLGSGVGLSLIGVFSKFASEKGYSPLTSQFYTFIFATLGAIPFADITNLSLMISIDFTCIGYFLLISLISTVLPFILFGTALKKLSAGTAGIFSSLEVVVGALTGVFVFNEKFGFFGILGIVIMFSSLILFAVKNKMS